MSRFVLLLLIVVSGNIARAQFNFTAYIQTPDREPLAGATVSLKGTGKAAIANENGYVILTNIPAGRHILVFTHAGYSRKETAFVFSAGVETDVDIVLERSEETMEDVTVSSTRSHRTIRNLPTRVEIISGEELEEKGNMKPGDIRMLLNESTGIQAQQTSATSYNSSLRIQGLDGRYTQIMRDGFPLYTGFSAGLGIMQVTPLDLKQVEVIKGSSSTLYGGGAIAGLVNLVSKTPSTDRELSFMANGTSARGLDLSGFFSQKIEKIGLTLFASHNSNSPYDPAGIGFTAIPKFERYTINPKLFIYFNENTTFNIGISTIREERIGGDINFIKNGTTGYFEKNTTNRISAQTMIHHQLDHRSALNFKSSFSRYNRRISVPGYYFEGLQTSGFSEASYVISNKNVEWITGINFLIDKFTERNQPDILPRDYNLKTFGGFIQNSWKTSKWMTLETGLRGDYVSDYDFNLLPRFAALFTINEHLSSRLGAGLGYKAPTVFTEDAERVQFQNVLPINIVQAKTERSFGSNFDVNFRTSLFQERLLLSVNQLFFYTRINDPLVLVPISGSKLEFVNTNGFVDTKGMETNIRLETGDFKLFIGYTYADVNQNFNDVKSWFTLTARHRLNNVLMYENEGKWKVGLEAYYVSAQRLNDGLTGRPYWLCGVMAEKIWDHFSVFVNFENIFDTRQTRFDNIFTGSSSDPRFRDIYAPLDGFVVNGGVKVRL